MYQILNRADFDAAFYIGRRRKISRAGLEAWIKKQVGEGVNGGDAETWTFTRCNEHFNNFAGEQVQAAKCCA